MELPSSTLLLVLSTIQSYVVLLHNNTENMNYYQAWCRTILQTTRDRVLSQDISSLHAIDKTVRKELLLFLLTCHDPIVNQWITTTYSTFSVDHLEYLY